MTEDEFISYVGRLEIKQKQHPVRFRLWAAFSLLSGFVLIFLLLLVSVFLLAIGYGCFVANPIFSLLLAAIGITLFFNVLMTAVRIITMQFAKPTGLALACKDAPRLFDRVGELSRKLKTPKIRGILLDCQFNASAVQLSRFGIFGFYRNYITIGLPLLLTLDKEHLDVVLAHEMAHISRLHGRFGAWILRLQASWLRLISSPSFSVFENIWFHRYQIKYANRINALSIVLRKANEFEAHRLAADVMGKKAATECLAIVYFLSHHWGMAMWEEYYRNAADEESVRPIARFMSDYFLNGLPESNLNHYYNILMNTKSGFGDSHPSYRELTDYLNIQPEIPAMPRDPAIRSYFADPQELENRFEDFWGKELSRSWRNRRRYCQNCQTKLDAMIERQKNGQSAEDTPFWIAFYTEELKGIGAAIDLYKAAYESIPNHAGVNYAIGMHELQYFNEEGINKVRLAITKNIKYFKYGYNAIHDFYLGQNKIDEAESYAQSQQKNKSVFDSYAFYIENITYETYYSNMDIDQNIASDLKMLLAKVSVIKKAYLSKKTKFGDKDIYILIMQSRSLKRYRHQLEDAIDETNCFFDLRNILVVIQNAKSLRRKFYREFIKLFSIRVK